MKDEIKISGKVIGQLNMPDACPRCFWLKHHTKDLPYQIFPGIFSTIDSYTKKIIHRWFDQFGAAPSWVPALANATGYLKAPHWSKFKRLDIGTGITLSGVVDDLFTTVNGNRIIPDYKTAKFTSGQDKLLPMYAAQLNAYRWIDEGEEGNYVESLPLIYFEPQTDENNLQDDVFKIDGFMMGFTAHTAMIDLDDDLIPRLLSRAADIIFSKKTPAPANGCSDCEKLDKLADTVKLFS